jgi:WhiB family redox-sensing transcriptional regulator
MRCGGGLLVGPPAHAERMPINQGRSRATDWVTQAGCRDRDPAEFTGEDLSDADLEAARAVCWSCPVVRQCAGYAREIEATWGLWAGRWRTPRSPSRDQRVA